MSDRWNTTVGRIGQTSATWWPIQRLGTARNGSARLGMARHGSARLGTLGTAQARPLQRPLLITYAVGISLRVTRDGCE